MNSGRTPIQRFSSQFADSSFLAILLACVLLFPAGCARRFSGRGMVLSIDSAAHTVLVSHREIPQYMPAMAMPFRVRRPAMLTGLYPGAQVEFKLVARK